MLFNFAQRRIKYVKRAITPTVENNQSNPKRGNWAKSFFSILDFLALTGLAVQAVTIPLWVGLMV